MTALLAGKEQKGETAKAIAACNDYLRMGPGRSLAKLRRIYGEATAQRPPTRHLRTLEKWSSLYGWRERAALFDAQVEAEKNARHREIMETGLALPAERVQRLKELAAVLGQELMETDKRWLPDVKQIGGGEHAEKVEIVRFNSAIVEQFRGVLDDIAKETGGRRQRLDHLVNQIDFSKLTDDQLDRIAEGEDPLRVILSGYGTGEG